MASFTNRGKVLSVGVKVKSDMTNRKWKKEG
jgi:hypothetical protein